MKILVDRLSPTPQEFDFEAGSAWWRQAISPRRDLPDNLPEPFRFQLEAYMAADDLVVQGTVEGAVPLECSRCLARYRQGLRESFRVVLEPAGLRQPADPEAAQALMRDGLCLSEDVGSGWFRGDEIDMGPFFQQVVSLALPLKPLCREECKGLCSRCGADLNQGPCGCPEIENESPFALLQQLRDTLTGGED